MRKKALSILAGLALAAGFLCAGLFVWASSLFSEPSAREVPSVAGELGATRVLAVFAHPDDELRVAGLLEAAKARDHAFTALVTATRGEKGSQVPKVARQRDLAQVRTAEVLKSGYALGIDEQEVWDFPDSGLAGVDFERLTARVEAAMERYKPDLIVTFWPASGESGHPDHMRIGLAAQAAAHRLSEMPAVDGYRGAKWIAYVVAPRRGIRAIGGEAGAFVAANEPAPDLAMKAKLSTRLRGWEIHASQEYSIPTTYRLSARLYYLLWGDEFYKVTELKERR
ncbi:MAG: PIG-L family deacetylase [Parvibaculum sedimenti]|uniref:PIG-L family deacetylase n=1 Tax=Parvibaculum sedimenti TaxID=2608632 RepID=UPI003BB6DBE9